MDGEEQVEIRFLEGLGDGVQLTFVATAVVALALARHRTHKVRMNAHREVHRNYPTAIRYNSDRHTVV